MRVALAIALATLLLAACGPTPPQAPFPYAKELDSATSDISTACGEAAAVTAFGGSDLRTIEAAAGRSARKLASVYRRDPSWIYQGETVRELVSDSASMLASCQLPAALSELKRATSRR